MNFATVRTVQEADFIVKVIECPIPFLLLCHCDVGVIIWFALKKRINFSIFEVIITVRITDLVQGNIRQRQNADSDSPSNWFWIPNNCYKFSSKGLEA